MLGCEGLFALKEGITQCGGAVLSCPITLGNGGSHVHKVLSPSQLGGTGSAQRLRARLRPTVEV